MGAHGGSLILVTSLPGAAAAGQKRGRLCPDPPNRAGGGCRCLVQVGLLATLIPACPCVRRPAHHLFVVTPKAEILQGPGRSLIEGVPYGSGVLHNL